MLRWHFLLIRAVALASCSSQSFAQEKQATLDESGVYHLPSFSVPPSALTSDEYRRKLIEQGKAAAATKSTGKSAPTLDLTKTEDVVKFRAQIDAERRKSAERLLQVFPVKVTPKVIAGVQTDVVEPKAGVSSRNKDRVLINLHGGGMIFGARWEGQVASIPIAGLGGFKVITVDYRMAPEHRYPAAEEDVIRVYRELLKTYHSQNIGFYGHSAGAHLTAAVIARIISRGLPSPGAASLDGGGAASRRGGGDSIYLSGAFLFGIVNYPPSSEDLWNRFNLYSQNVDPDDPLAFPADSSEIMGQFPPTLILNATRDPTLSGGLYTHRQLVNSGVETELHVWEGLPHSYHYDESLPESRENYRVLIRFFDKHLGVKFKRSTSGL